MQTQHWFNRRCHAKEGNVNKHTIFSTWKNLNKYLIEIQIRSFSNFCGVHVDIKSIAGCFNETQYTYFTMRWPMLHKYITNIMFSESSFWAFADQYRATPLHHGYHRFFAAAFSHVRLIFCLRLWLAKTSGLDLVKSSNWLVRYGI